MSKSSLPTVIAAKLFALPRRADLLPRPRLTNRIVTAIGAGTRVVVISSPPGFGKSTIAAEVAATLQAGGGMVAWLSIDAEDNDVTRFLTHLVATIEQALPGTGKIARDELEALVAEGTPSPPPATVLALLANGLPQSAQVSMMVVLDDYHLIENPALHHALAAWVEQLPIGVTLMLCTRSDPPLPLARWRVRRQLLEVRVADLQFTPAETTALFQQAAFPALSPEATALVTTRTEGWAAGLQLVALALEGEAAAGDDPVPWLASLGGDDRYIADYLVEEVLSHQPAEIQHFLLQSSVVERLNGPLCDALLELPSGTGQAMLEQVERANLFLIPLDQRRQWYRYHHLFRDLLQKQLMRGNPDAVARLHQRAAQWYAAQGLLDGAIEEALKGEAWTLAAELMTTSAPTVMRQGGWTTMRRWLASLPQDQLAVSPRLSTLYAHMLIYTGEPAFALELLARAEALWRAHNDRAGLADALLVRMNLARLQADPVQARAIGSQIAALAIPLSPAVERTVACNLAIACQQADEGAHAIEALTTYLAETSAEDALILTLLARSHLGDALAGLGNEEAALAAYQRVIELATGRNLFPRMRAHIGLATLAAKGGQWQEVTQQAQEAISLAQSSERTLYTAPAWLALARVALARNDFEHATRLAQQSLTLARTLGNRRQVEEVEKWQSEPASLPRATQEIPQPRTSPTATSAESPIVEALTVREEEVLRLLATGASNQQIANELVITLNTVKKHVANLLAKLDAESRTQAIARARERGLL